MVRFDSASRCLVEVRSRKGSVALTLRCVLDKARHSIRSGLLTVPRTAPKLPFRYFEVCRRSEIGRRRRCLKKATIIQELRRNR
jgi:hypothetical protein